MSVARSGWRPRRVVKGRYSGGLGSDIIGHPPVANADALDLTWPVSGLGRRSSQSHVSALRARHQLGLQSGGRFDGRDIRSEE